MRKLVGLILLAAAITVMVGRETDLFPMLKSDARIARQAAGFYLLPTNQLLRPWGEQTVIPGRPVDMVYSSGQRILAVLNWRSVLLLDGSTGTRIAEVPTRNTSYTGIAFRPGDREIWVSETSRNGPDGIAIIPLNELGMPGKLERIDLSAHPLPAGIAFSPDGKRAYIAYSRNNSLAVWDAVGRHFERQIPTGIAPFGVAVARSTGRIWVTNRGGRAAQQGDTTAPSSGTQVVTDPITGSSITGTVSTLDAETLTPAEIQVGLQPSAVVLSPDEKTVVVTNSHSDSISLLDAHTNARTDIKIPTYPEAALGSQPNGAAFSADGKTIFVACGGNNAIALVNAAGRAWKVGGAIPTGWFPTAIAVAADASLRVLNIKGVGNTDDHKGTFNSRAYEGSLLRIPSVTTAQLDAGTREVRAANAPQFEPQGGVANLPSLGIQHVFLIVKENRTYDQVFGDIAKANGDPKLVMFGRDVTPNHHALAERYVVLDNFHTGGAISFDGHQWLMQGFVSDYVERAFASSPRGYAWNMADSLTVAPTGFFWQSATRPISVRIYGEFQLPARWDPASQSARDMDENELLSWMDYWKLYKEGKWQNEVGARSGVPALQPICSQRYAFNSTSIPDQIRVEEYLRELAEREKSGAMPNLSVLTLNNDHTNGTNPRSPTPKAMVADNDLALGRVVEGISKSRFWAKSLILVVEDDAQNGLDHVDGHRTLALAIGPHVRRDAVVSTHYNHTSMIRTIQDIYKIPPRTRFLASARAMNAVFMPKPNYEPYKCLTPKQPLDEMNKPLAALNGRQLWAAKESAKMNWAEVDDIDQDKLNRILWWDAKGYDVPYPKVR